MAAASADATLDAQSTPLRGGFKVVVSSERRLHAARTDTNHFVVNVAEYVPVGTPVTRIQLVDVDIPCLQRLIEPDWCRLHVTAGWLLAHDARDMQLLLEDGGPEAAAPVAAVVLPLAVDVVTAWQVDGRGEWVRLWLAHRAPFPAAELALVQPLRLFGVPGAGRAGWLLPPASLSNDPAVASALVVRSPELAAALGAGEGCGALALVAGRVAGPHALAELVTAGLRRQKPGWTVSLAYQADANAWRLDAGLPQDGCQWVWSGGLARFLGVSGAAAPEVVVPRRMPLHAAAAVQACSPGDVRALADAAAAALAAGVWPAAVAVTVARQRGGAATALLPGGVRTAAQTVAALAHELAPLGVTLSQAADASRLVLAAADGEPFAVAFSVPRLATALGFVPEQLAIPAAAHVAAKPPLPVPLQYCVVDGGGGGGVGEPAACAAPWTWRVTPVHHDDGVLRLAVHGQPDTQVRLVDAGPGGWRLDVEPGCFQPQWVPGDVVLLTWGSVPAAARCVVVAAAPPCVVPAEQPPALPDPDATVRVTFLPPAAGVDICCQHAVPAAVPPDVLGMPASRVAGAPGALDAVPVLAGTHAADVRQDRHVVLGIGLNSAEGPTHTGTLYYPFVRPQPWLGPHATMFAKVARGVAPLRSDFMRSFEYHLPEGSLLTLGTVRVVLLNPSGTLFQTHRHPVAVTLHLDARRARGYVRPPPRRALVEDSDGGSTDEEAEEALVLAAAGVQRLPPNPMPGGWASGIHGLPQARPPL